MTDIVQKAPQLSDSDERAQRAVKVFRSMQPTLTSYARIYTRNPRVRVEMSRESNGKTDGTVIHYRPPLELGDKTPHDRNRCYKRTSDGRAACPACAIREQVIITIYHEIAHIAEGTFDPVSERDLALALERGIEESGSKYATKVKQRIDEMLLAGHGHMGVASTISPFLPGILNALEDARVNRNMFEARRGTKIMFDQLLKDTFTKGVEQRNPVTGQIETKLWKEYALNSQIVCAIYCAAAGYDYSDWFHEVIIEALEDDQLKSLIDKIHECRKVGDTFELAFPILARCRELGFLKSETDPESEEEDDSSSDSSGDSGGEEEAPPESGSDGSSEGDNSDDADGSGQEQDSGGDRSENEDSSGDSGSGEDVSDDVSDGERAGEEPSGDDDSGGEQQDSSDDQPAGSDGSEAGDGERMEQDGSSSPDRGPDEEGRSEVDGTDSDSEDGSDSSSEAGMGTEAEPRNDADSERPDSAGGPRSDMESRTDLAKGEEELRDSDEPVSESDMGPSEGDLPEHSEPTGEGDDELLGRPEDSEGDEGEQEDAVPIDTGADEGLGGTKLIIPDDIEMGSAEQALEDVANVQGHDGDKPDAMKAGPSSGKEDEALDIAIIQGLYFETPSKNIAGARVHRWGKPDLGLSGVNNVWDRYAGMASTARRVRLGIDGDIDAPDESILGPALLQLRRVFADNKRGKHQTNLKSGRINTRVLGKRAPVADARLFKHHTQPGKKDYAVLIGVDISGSTVGKNILLEKRAVMAKADLLSRMGIKFAIMAHTGVSGNGVMELDVYIVKDFEEPWSSEVKDRFAKIGPASANLDGHALEFLRKAIERVNVTDRIIMYYSDGKMPAENHDEELEILQREIRYCKQKGIKLLGVGIRTDSPTRHGLDTVEVQDDEDVIKVVRHLEKHLLEN